MHKKRIAIGQGKEHVWAVTTHPGPHPREKSINLINLVRDILEYVDTNKEARNAITKGEIIVNNKVRKDPRYGIGLMDIVEIPKLKKIYRVMPGKKGISLHEIPKKDSKIRLSKIMGKSLIGKGRIQLNLHDGRNILVEKDNYRVKDSLVIDNGSGKIQGSIPFKEGNIAMVVHGRHSGEVGKIIEILPGSATHRSITTMEEKGKEQRLQTRTEYLMAIGEDKSLIEVE